MHIPNLSNRIALHRPFTHVYESFSCARRRHDRLSTEYRTASASVIENVPDKLHPPQLGQAARNGVRHLPPRPLLALPLPDRRLPRPAPSHPTTAY